VTSNDVGYRESTRLSARSAICFGHANTRWLT
jgi:hypothetical protein